MGPGVSREDTGAEPDPTNATPGASVSPSEPETTGGQQTNATSGHYTADVMGIFGDPSQPENDLYVFVPENATALIAELHWTGDQSDFDIQVQTPTYCSDTGTPFVDDAECEVRYLTQQEGQGVIIVSRPDGTLGPGELRAEFGPGDLERERCVGSDQCAWRIMAVPDLAVDSDFDLRVTIFMEIPAPDGFTAFTD